ncbi:MAG: transposase [Candidatus Moraniibacteriota bacterium]
MSDKFKEKYKIKSARLKGYDYSQNGMYFITICTKNREEFFGEIKNGEMALNEIGKIVKEEWLQTSIIHPNILLDEWIIMPNHIHGIIEIKNVETPRWGVSLGSIINQIKSICTKKIWKSGYSDFAWQSRFYDHIIRNDESLNKIREYIRINPQKWEEDRNNVENIFM